MNNMKIAAKIEEKEEEKHLLKEDIIDLALQLMDYDREIHDLIMQRNQLHGKLGVVESDLDCVLEEITDLEGKLIWTAN